MLDTSKNLLTINSSKEFLELINVKGRSLFGKRYIEYDLKSLRYYSHPRDKAFYKSFEIPKKSGGLRKIHAPISRLKYLQVIVKCLLEDVFEPNENIHGFIINKSIYTNALPHVGKNYVFNIDLENFFPSINEKRVLARLASPPFNLKDEKLFVTESDANHLLFVNYASLYLGEQVLEEKKENTSREVEKLIEQKDESSDDSDQSNWFKFI
jgi:hypothetical protein